VPSKDKLAALIDTLIAAVKAGELDEALKKATKPGEAAHRGEPELRAVGPELRPASRAAVPEHF
jgi:hypothetical protein